MPSCENLALYDNQLYDNGQLWGYGTRVDPVEAEIIVLSLRI